MNWSGSVQTQMGPTWLTELLYQGSSGVGLASSGGNLNQLSKSIYDSTDLTLLNAVYSAMQNYRPYPQFGTISYLTNAGHNTYHGFTTRVEKRYASRRAHPQRPLYLEQEPLRQHRRRLAVLQLDADQVSHHLRYPAPVHRAGNVRSAGGQGPQVHESRRCPERGSGRMERRLDSNGAVRSRQSRLLSPEVPTGTCPDPPGPTRFHPT